MIVSLGLIAHLIGDYPLQSHTMATRKVSSWTWAVVHATFYTFPFAALLGVASAFGVASWRTDVALAVILLTHAAIDRLGIARKWCVWYGVGHPGLWWTARDRATYREEQAESIYHTWDGSKLHPWVRGGNSHMQDEARRQAPEFPAPPPFLGTWLTIIVDNTLHITINTAALLWAVWGTPWI